MINIDDLKSSLEYNKKTGDFVWLRNRGKAKKGCVAGSKDKQGYTVIFFQKKRHFAHRLAWFYVHGYFPEHQIDHVDRDKTNNSLSNLRHVTMSCNIINRPIRSNNKSGITGVYFNSGKWVAAIKKDNITHSLGRYQTKIEAAKARLKAEKEFGFIKCNKDSSASRYIKENTFKAHT